MKTYLLGFAALFAPLVAASPHRHYHHHADILEKRDENQDTYVTKWVSVVKTVSVTTTVWVTAEAAPSQVMEANLVYAPSTPSDLPVKPVEEKPSFADHKPLNHMAVNFSHSNEALKPETPAPQADVPKFEPVMESAPVTEPTPIINSAPVTESEPVTESAPVNESAPSIEHAPAAEPAPVIDSTPIIESTRANEFAPVIEPAPLAEPIPATTPNTPEIIQDSIAINNLTATKDHSAKEGCSSSNPCDGDITYYDPGVGLGACGWKNTKDEPVVALPHEFMGFRSNGNSYCGKTITILHDGKKSTARVVDKCMGCTGFSIDLSDAVFSQLAALSVGRTKATWWIN